MDDDYHPEAIIGWAFIMLLMWIAIGLIWWLT